ncbi:uncharacterized protein LOC141849684 [Brevipalpus obovatus]|uniref:uncharacterized protein LOC141849684 n=1 Tax=Brevipalpus obovatus TaxID=246614 RepID=UPI003D9E5D74
MDTVKTSDSRSFSFLSQSSSFTAHKPYTILDLIDMTCEPTGEINDQLPSIESLLRTWTTPYSNRDQSVKREASPDRECSLESCSSPSNFESIIQAELQDDEQIQSLLEQSGHVVIPEEQSTSSQMLSLPSPQYMDISEADSRDPIKYFFLSDPTSRLSTPDPIPVPSIGFQIKTSLIEPREKFEIISMSTKETSSRVQSSLAQKDSKKEKVLRKIANHYSVCGKTRVKTWKKYSKKKHLTQDEMDKKRDIANQQERTRMHRLNSALKNLRNAIPYEFSRQPPEKNLSKIKTLRIAIEYIRQLTNVLNDIPDNKSS